MDVLGVNFKLNSQLARRRGQAQAVEVQQGSQVVVVEIQRWRTLVVPVVRVLRRWRPRLGVKHIHLSELVAARACTGPAT